MSIEDAVKTRIIQLISQSHRLSVGGSHDQCVDREQRQHCSGWITAAQNAVHLVCVSANAPYRLKADRIASDEHGLGIHRAVGEFAVVLRNLLDDAESGLLASVADQARAETFDNFLDHAEAYWRDHRKNESGVIAGVVFEDTLRRICRKQGIVEKDVKLDSLISELQKQGDLSGTKAKRARAAAHVRTKASHAQWAEFELDDVKSTIDFSRELLSKLDS